MSSEGEKTRFQIAFKLTKKSLIMLINSERISRCRLKHKIVLIEIKFLWLWIIIGAMHKLIQSKCSLLRNQIISVCVFKAFLLITIRFFTLLKSRDWETQSCNHALTPFYVHCDRKKTQHDRDIASQSKWRKKIKIWFGSCAMDSFVQTLLLSALLPSRYR